MSEGKQFFTPLKLVVVIVLVLGAFTAMTLGIVNRLLAAKQMSPAQAAQPGTGPKYALETFNVNLADQESRRFLKATITLELDAPKLAKELEKRKAQVRDIIIALLREKKASELKDGNTAVQQLKEEIKSRLNAVLTSGKVTAVYFTEFIVQ